MCVILQYIAIHDDYSIPLYNNFNAPYNQHGLWFVLSMSDHAPSRTTAPNMVIAATAAAASTATTSYVASNTTSVTIMLQYWLIVWAPNNLPTLTRIVAQNLDN